MVPFTKVPFWYHLFEPQPGFSTGICFFLFHQSPNSNVSQHQTTVQGPFAEKQKEPKANLMKRKPQEKPNTCPRSHREHQNLIPQRMLIGGRRDIKRKESTQPSTLRMDPRMALFKKRQTTNQRKPSKDRQANEIQERT